LLVKQIRDRLDINRGAEPIPEGPVGLSLPRLLKSLYPTIIYTKKHIMAFETLWWKSVVLTSVTPTVCILKFKF
jgi:hypothetical protein